MSDQDQSQGAPNVEALAARVAALEAEQIVTIRSEMRTLTVGRFQHVIVFTRRNGMSSEVALNWAARR